MTDESFSQQLGQILFDISPKNSKQIIMKAALPEVGDTCSFEFDYVDESGNVHWFTGGGVANTKLLKVLVQLREEQIKSGQTSWESCTFVIDVEAESFDMNFVYADS